MTFKPLLRAIGRGRGFCVATLVSFFLLGTDLVRAELDFGFEARYGEKLTTAFEELEPLAEAGDPRAQLWLGLMYYYGRGVVYNERLASKWIRKSANQLYHDAQTTLCVIYYSCPGGGNVTQ